MTIIGIDNGVSGTIGVWQNGGVFMYKTPVFKEKNYQKTKDSELNRIDTQELKRILRNFIEPDMKIRLERPMINVSRFNASISAARALEATLIVLEELCIRDKMEYIDSKTWQNKMIPLLEGCKDTKDKSWKVGNELYPQFMDFKHPDRDGLLIMEYVRLYR